MSYRFYAGWERSDQRFSSVGGFRNYLLAQASMFSGTGGEKDPL